MPDPLTCPQVRNPRNGDGGRARRPAVTASRVAAALAPERGWTAAACGPERHLGPVTHHGLEGPHGSERPGSGTENRMPESLDFSPKVRLTNRSRGLRAMRRFRAVPTDLFRSRPEAVRAAMRVVGIPGAPRPALHFRPEFGRRDRSPRSIRICRMLRGEARRPECNVPYRPPETRPQGASGSWRLCSVRR